MNLRITAILILLPFTALTIMAIVTDGPNGFPNAIMHDLLSFQIWFDLVIAMIFWCAWVLKDAKSDGRNGIPWVIAALLIGAFAPLLYMVMYQRWSASPAQSTSASSTESASRLRMISAFVFVLLGVITAAALIIDGTDIPAVVMRTWSNIQIWVDLVIVMVLWLAWMIKDAQQSGRNPWGWVILALAIGSFSPLLYTAIHGRWPASHPPAAQ
ncbi:MAG: hypothetical protein AAF512_19090 [Pseudomonadota bacterium]